MKTLFLITAALIWTNVQAQTSLNTLGKYNSKDQVYEITYDEMANELSRKKQDLAPAPTSSLGIQKLQASLGYTLSSMDFETGNGSSSFMMNGIDLRVMAPFTNSKWLLEGSFKNYGKASLSGKSVEARALSALIKTEDKLTGSYHYVVGLGPSLHFVSTRDNDKKRDDTPMSLNIQGGVRAPITQKLSWGAEIGAHSPLSSSTLKSGVDVSVLLSTQL